MDAKILAKSYLKVKKLNAIFLRAFKERYARGLNYIFEVFIRILFGVWYDKRIVK